MHIATILVHVCMVWYDGGDIAVRPSYLSGEDGLPLDGSLIRH